MYVCMYSPWLPACIPHRRSRFRAHRASPKERARDKRGWVDVGRVMWSAKRLGTTSSDFDWLLRLNTNIDTMLSSRTRKKTKTFLCANAPKRTQHKEVGQNPPFSRGCQWANFYSNHHPDHPVGSASGGSLERHLLDANQVFAKVQWATSTSKTSPAQFSKLMETSADSNVMGTPTVQDRGRLNAKSSLPCRSGSPRHRPHQRQSLSAPLFAGKQT